LRSANSRSDRCPHGWSAALPDKSAPLFRARNVATSAHREIPEGCSTHPIFLTLARTFDKDTRDMGYRSRGSGLRSTTRASCLGTQPIASRPHWAGSHRMARRVPARRPAPDRVAGDRWSDRSSSHCFCSAPEIPDAPNRFPFGGPSSHIGAQGRKTEFDDHSRTFERPRNIHEERVTRAAPGQHCAVSQTSVIHPGYTNAPER